MMAPTVSCAISKELINKNTGEVIELVPSTHDMNTEEFSVFLDKAAVWLATFANIVVLPADLFHDKNTK